MRLFSLSAACALSTALLAACGTEASREGDPEAGPVAEVTSRAPVPDTVRQGVDTSQGTTPDSVLSGAAVQGGVVPEAGPREGAGPTTSAPSEPATQEPQAEPLSVEERLDLLLEAQRSTQERLDSLARLVTLGEARDTADEGGPASAEAGEVLGEAGNQVRNFGVGILWSLVVVFVFNLLIRAVSWVLDQLSERSAKRRLFFKGLVPVVRIVLWLFAGYLIVRVIFQVDAQGIVAGAAALGVAIGFAAQDLLKNLFGGIILVFDQPFQVGDKIRVGETYGEVTSIGLRSTRIVTPDDNLVSVPNAQVVDQQVANANAGELNCQVVIDLYLPAEVDEAKAKKIAFEAAVDSKYVYLNKPIVVLIRDELDRRVFTRVRIKAYVLDPRHEFLFESDVTERARAGFRAAGLIGGGSGAPGGDGAGVGPHGTAPVSQTTGAALHGLD